MTKITLFQYFIRSYTGGNQKKLYQTPMLFAIAAFGIYSAEIQIAIAPFVLYLMSSCFMVSMMFLALSSTENASDMKNLFMMPLDRNGFLVSYIGVVSLTTFLTRAWGLLAIAIAVSRPSLTEIANTLICCVNAILISVCAFAFRKRPYIGVLWFAAAIAGLYLLCNTKLFLPLLLLNAVACLITMCAIDPYVFYTEEGSLERSVKGYTRHSIIRYLVRYLFLHKNYLVNSGIMLICACIFPVYFQQLGTPFIYPIGFAIVLVNTPLCILLSCSPDTEQMVRILPGQKRAFCVPYCMFLFLCNLIPTTLYATVSCIACHTSPAIMFPAAIFFSLQGAILSVILEWFFPIRGWKLETDLWHHPRKYIMPMIMVLFAGLIATFPVAVYGLLAALVLESIVLYTFSS